MAHDVFISYSSKDKPIGDAVCATLEASGIRCWIAPRDIAPGADWGESIISAIQASRVFVLVFSGHANESQQIKREVERAVHNGIAIIPLRIEEVMPERSLEYFLSTPHWLDAFTPPLERHLNYLATVVRQIIDGAPTSAARPLAPPPPPIYRRRAVIGGGIAAAFGIAGIGGWLALRPGAPPSFVGKWQAAKVQIAVVPLGTWTLPLADLLTAAFAGPDVTASFEVAGVGQYTYSVSAVDHGAVALAGQKLTFTSSLTSKSVTGSYTVQPPPTAGTMSWVGGEPGDSGLFLQGNAWQIDFAGKPINGIVGSWRDKNGMIGYDTYVIDLDINADNTYRLRLSRTEQGVFEADNGKWTRTPQIGPPSSGTYSFSGPGLVTVVSSNSSIQWKRIS